MEKLAWAPMVRIPFVLVERGVLLVLLGIAAGIDARTRRIPNGLIGASLALWILLLGLRVGRYGLDWSFLLSRVIAGVALAGASLLLAVVLQRKAKEAPLGGGDVKLLFAMGLYLGFVDATLTVGVGCVAAVLGLCIQSIVRGRGIRSIRGATFAFAPWLWAGAVAVVVGRLLV